MKSHWELGLEEVGFHEELCGPLDGPHGCLKLPGSLVALQPAMAYVRPMVKDALGTDSTAGRAALQSDSMWEPPEIPRDRHDAADCCMRCNLTYV